MVSSVIAGLGQSWEIHAWSRRLENCRRLRRRQLATSQPLATAASKIAVLGHSGATTAATVTSKIAVLGHSGVTTAAGLDNYREPAPRLARELWNCKLGGCAERLWRQLLYATALWATGLPKDTRCKP